MRVLIVGDVGAKDGIFHAGDEAMLESAVDELRRRGVETVVISADPAESQLRYGVPTIARADFGSARTPSRAAREERLAAVTAAATGHDGALGWQDPALHLIDAVAAADGVLVAGGGNLSAIWPEHLYERAAIVAVAVAFGKPVIVSGQTLGPALTARDGELLARLLSAATLVGLRERPSFELARRLGVPETVLRHTVDDATVLGEIENPLGARGDYGVATFAPYSGAGADLFDELVAKALDRAAELTGLELLLLPHAGSIIGPDADDSVKHSSLRRRMTTAGVTELGMLSAKQIASITRHAKLSISTRYHPVVFALSGSVPAVGITLDEYTGIKINGAFENLGLGRSAVPAVGLAAGVLDEAIAQTWARREQISSHLSAVLPDVRAQAAIWWDDVARVIRGESVSTSVERQTAEFVLFSAPLAERVRQLDRWQSSESSILSELRLAREGSDAEVEAERRRLVERERELGEASAEMEFLESRLVETEHALDAARALASEIAEPLFARRLGHQRVQHPENELEMLLNTRTFRWTRGPRAVYGRVRQVALRVFRGR